MPRLRELDAPKGLTVTLDGAQYDELVALAKAERRSLAHLIRDAIDAFLSRKKREAA